MSAYLSYKFGSVFEISLPESYSILSKQLSRRDTKNIKSLIKTWSIIGTNRCQKWEAFPNNLFKNLWLQLSCVHCQHRGLAFPGFTVDTSERISETTRIIVLERWKSIYMRAMNKTNQKRTSRTTSINFGSDEFHLRTPCCGNWPLTKWRAYHLPICYETRISFCTLPSLACLNP